MTGTGYTLLIVESPTLAKSINTLQLPGVETLLTGGYAWKPIFDPSTGKLKAKADPKHREFRTELKKKAAWATKIVVATDADPSGRFIAHCIGKLLASRQLHQGRLKHIGKSGILETIEGATTLESSPEPLRKFLAAHNMLMRRISAKLGIKVSIGALLAAAIFQSELPFTHWKDGTGQTYTSDIPIPHNFGKPITVLPDDGFRYPSPLLPPSTADVLFPVGGSFAKGYEVLCRLFERIPDETGMGLISYPRTHSKGYEVPVWDALTEKFRRIVADFTALPVQMRTFPKPNGHNAIHVLDPLVSPKDARMLTRRSEAILYGIIHERTLKSVSAPVHPKKTILKSTSGNVFFVDGGQIHHIPEKLFPVMDAPGFMQGMMDSGWVKPSALGREMDRLIADGAVALEPGNPDSVIPDFGKLPIGATAEKQGFLAKLQYIATMIEMPGTGLDEINGHITALFE